MHIFSFYRYYQVVYNVVVAVTNSQQWGMGVLGVSPGVGKLFDSRATMGS